MTLATSYKELRVYKKAIDSTADIFNIRKRFPAEERYSMTDQMRRSSRSVCANIAEAWRKRRYKAAFIAKLSDAESEAAETQVWIELAVKFGYLTVDEAFKVDDAYDHILGQLIWMISNADDWIIKPFADTPIRRHADPPTLTIRRRNGNQTVPRSGCVRGLRRRVSGAGGQCACRWCG